MHCPYTPCHIRTTHCMCMCMCISCACPDRDAGASFLDPDMGYQGCDRFTTTQHCEMKSTATSPLFGSWSNNTMTRSKAEEHTDCPVLFKSTVWLIKKLQIDKIDARKPCFVVGVVVVAGIASPEHRPRSGPIRNFGLTFKYLHDNVFIPFFTLAVGMLWRHKRYHV